jgi:hypothetical protein
MEQVMTRCMVKTICICRISAAKHQVFATPSSFAGGGEGITVCSSSTKCELGFINMKGY